MRHPTTDALELQMDALLRSAADFEPELETPFDLVERAMRRATRQVAVVRIQRPIIALLWGGAAGAAAASAAAAILISSPPSPTDNPIQTRQALGSVTPGYRVTAEVDPPAPVSSRPRRSFRVRHASQSRPAAVETPVMRASWQAEEVEQTVEHEIRPALRLRFDEEGQPVDLQAGILETLTVSENPTACGQSDAEKPGEAIDETTGESRPKEEHLPSKEN